LLPYCSVVLPLFFCLFLGLHAQTSSDHSTCGSRGLLWSLSISVRV
jgi:hypothetical protein